MSYQQLEKAIKNGNYSKMEIILKNLKKENQLTPSFLNNGVICACRQYLLNIDVDYDYEKRSAQTIILIMLKNFGANLDNGFFNNLPCYNDNYFQMLIDLGANPLYYYIHFNEQNLRLSGQVFIRHMRRPRKYAALYSENGKSYIYNRELMPDIYIYDLLDGIIHYFNLEFDDIDLNICVFLLNSRDIYFDEYKEKSSKKFLKENSRKTFSLVMKVFDKIQDKLLEIKNSTSFIKKC